MANLSGQLLDDLESHPPAVCGGLMECDGLNPSASLSLFHQGNPREDIMRSLQKPVVLTPQLVQRSLSVGSTDTCACTMCHQVFNSNSARVTHVQLVHAGQKPFECPTCGKCFANSSYLSQHNRIHLGVKPYRCQLCDRRFTQLCHLQQHIRTHTGEKPYRCCHAGCTKAFSQLSNLQSHTRSHMTDKPFRCNSCYKCFSDERGLQEHIPKHTETKHLKTKICTVCGKSYAQETYLARHMVKHETTGDVHRPLARQQLDGAIFGVGSDSLLDFHPSVIPHDLIGNVSCVLPSFPAFRAGRVGGMMQSSVGATKIPDILPGLSNLSTKMPVSCDTRGLESLPYATPQTRNLE